MVPTLRKSVVSHSVDLRRSKRNWTHSLRANKFPKQFSWIVGELTQIFPVSKPSREHGRLGWPVPGVTTASWREWLLSACGSSHPTQANSCEKTEAQLDQTCWYFKRSQDGSFVVWTPEFCMIAINSIENQNNSTKFFAACVCDLPVCCIKSRELGKHGPWHARKSSALENMLWLACSQIHQRLAEKESAHTFQIISPLIGQTPLNYHRCTMQGVIMTIRKMVTLRLTHLPSILTNCIFSLLSCCSLSPAGAVNPTVSTEDKHPVESQG